MRSSYLFFKMVVVVVAIATPCSALDRKGFFHDNGRKGFYWYEKTVATKQDESFKMPERDPYTYSDLWNVHPDAFKKILKNRMDLAIQTNSEEAVYRYLEIQDVAQRKAMAFAGVMGMVSQKHPEFSRKNITTMPQAGKDAYYRIKSEQTKQILEESADRFALIVFESPGCEYCEAQKPIIEAFQVKYGWPVKYLNIFENQQLAKDYSIDRTPAVMMLPKDSKKLINISIGVVSMADLQSRIVRAVRYADGQINAQQWFNEPDGIYPVNPPIRERN